jgi:hypothetical protein
MTTSTIDLDLSVLRCAGCLDPVSEDDSALEASYADINSGQPFEWRVWHSDCSGDDGYCIDLARIETHAEAAWWTDHLSGKEWYPRSNWRQLMAALKFDARPHEDM